MKKNLVVFVLIAVSIFLFQLPVKAKVFQESPLFTSYYVKMVSKSNSYRNTRTLPKIMDDENKAYFIISPRDGFYYSRDYSLNPIDIDEETMQEISRIIYYGYGYNNQNTNEYYAATQFLIYSAFKEYTVSFIDNLSQPITPFSTEIAQIKANMDNSFTAQNIHTDSKVVEIRDPYILKHFTIEGRNVSATEEENQISISLLNDQKSYTIHYIPKLDCKTLQMWQNENIKYIHMDAICENSYTTTIYYEKNEEIEPSEEIEKEKDKDNEKETETEIEQEKETEEEIKEEEESSEEVLENSESLLETNVNVPSTGKAGFSFFLLLMLLGNGYYVFKK